MDILDQIFGPEPPRATPAGPGTVPADQAAAVAVALATYANARRDDGPKAEPPARPVVAKSFPITAPPRKGGRRVDPITLKLKRRRAGR